MPSNPLHLIDRRSFLQSSAAVLLAESVPSFGAEARVGGTESVAIPDAGWRMWPDEKASWKDDTIYLPEDVKLATLPLNEPTGGWEALSSKQGIEVTLPATVEQFFWGLQGMRPYKDEYKFETTDDAVKNGAYYGVSWWWREIEIPAAFKGKRILLHVRAARQRAEVYLNRKLVGYSIMEELPFECDLTEAARPGERNMLAVRITNPGGRLDWGDTSRITWGKATFQKSHGFGGIDRALAITAHKGARISDLWVLNTPEARKVTAHAEIDCFGVDGADGRLRFAVVDPATGHELAHAEIDAQIKRGKRSTFTADLSCAEARLWDLDSPHLYRMEARWANGKVRTSSNRGFGFRWFAPERVGTNALFRLNGRRVRVYTAISWGFWALNGLFPTPELAEKEVAVAKEFNLNCLNFHRNLAKEEVLAIQDRRGLLRALEPGGGSQAVGRADQPPGFTERYMEAKIVGMIRAFRSHPSVIEYILQNEGRPDLKNPNLERIIRRMHAEDPSRSIVGTDGFATRAPEAWMEPYSEHFRSSLEGGAGGWWDDHTGAPSDVWQDAQYVSATNFLYYSTNQKEIVEWGEMKGAAAVDDHEKMVAQIKRHGGKSYDLADHEELLAIYEKFIDNWGFRKAFPTASALFQSIGRRAYESWGQHLENIRICDVNDYATISGWESTAMENHSGIVDNFREFKSNPSPIQSSLKKLRPVAKQKSIVVALGEKVEFDLWLLNDTNRATPGKLEFSIADPAGKRHAIGNYDAPAFTPDQMSYLVKENVTSPALDREGVWTTHFALNGDAGSAHQQKIYSINCAPHAFKNTRVGTVGLTGELASQVAAIPGLVLEPFKAGEHYDLVIAVPPSAKPTDTVSTDDVGADRRSNSIPPTKLPADVVAAFNQGMPLFVLCTSDGQATGACGQLAAEAGFKFSGMVGSSRASWMGTWFFVREHPVYDGLPVNRAFSIEYQVKGSDSNGMIVDGEGVEIIAAYSRDHDRKIGAGTFAFQGQGRKLLFNRITAMHKVFHRRLLWNGVRYLSGI